MGMERTHGSPVLDSWFSCIDEVLREQLRAWRSVHAKRNLLNVSFVQMNNIIVICGLWIAFCLSLYGYGYGYGYGCALFPYCCLRIYPKYHPIQIGSTSQTSSQLIFKIQNSKKREKAST